MKFCDVKGTRFIRIALLLLAMTSAGAVSLFAQQLGSIAYNKPNLQNDYDLWLIQPNGSGDTLVPITGICNQCPLLGAQHPAWSRDGQLIAVTGLVPGQGFQHLQGGYGMVVFRRSNPIGTLTGLAALGTALGGGPAAFSPDSTQLAFTDPGLGFQTYRAVNLDGSNPRTITLPLGEQVPYPGLDWSPTDANTLVVSMLDRSLSNVQQNAQLALVPPVGGGILQARPLTQPPYDLRYQIFDANPAFSPDGRFVAFSRLIHDLLLGINSTEIRKIDVTNPGNLQGLLLLQLPVGEFVGNISWSGDGSSLVFDRQTQFGNLGLWIYNGSSVVQLQQSPALNPSWGVPHVTADGDFDGDGKADYAVWRPSNGTWYVIPSKTPSNFLVQQWGVSTDIPVRGDYDGDGKTDFAVWRPSTGTWYVIPSNPSAPIIQQWGAQGDIPVPGDYDGDGKTDFAVWRPSTGTWFVIPSSNPSALIVKQWGTNGDIPVPGDYDGDGKTDFAVWRPSTGTWFIIPTSNPSAPIVQQWGTVGDIPVPVDYDGDRKTDIAVWRPSNGVWYIIPSATPGTFTITQWGTNGDVPIQKPIGQ